MSMHTRQKPGAVSSRLARDRLGIAAVLAFILAGVAPLTVSAGLIPVAYATTELTGIPAGFLSIAVLLAVFAIGYMAMSRHITNAGAFYAFIAQGLGKASGVAAALMALGAYSCLQIALYGMFGPQLASQASTHLGIHAPWWVWALGAWAVVALLGLLKVENTGRVLGVLTAVEIVVILALSISGLAHPAAGHLSFSALSPRALTSGGWGTAGVLAVIAVLAFSGFEQGPVLAEEAVRPRRTIPVTTFSALCLIGVVYGGSAWAMAAQAGDNHVVAAAGRQGSALLFGLGDGFLNQAGQWLYLTSLFAACLAFHNSVLRYAYSLGREGVLFGWLGRTAGNNIPMAASLAQSGTGFAVIGAFALAGWPPETGLFFGGGTTGGFGLVLLLALTCLAVIVFFWKDPRGEPVWSRLAAPAFAGAALIILAVLAVQHYSTLLGVQSGAPAAWLLPLSYLILAAAGLVWAMILRAWRPHVYQTIGLGIYTPASYAVSRHGGT
jgi:amino acid transporter